MWADEVPLEESPGLKVHGMLVVNTISQSVASLKDIPALVPILVDLNPKP